MGLWAKLPAVPVNVKRQNLSACKDNIRPGYSCIRWWLLRLAVPIFEHDKGARLHDAARNAQALSMCHHIRYRMPATAWQ